MPVCCVLSFQFFALVMHADLAQDARCGGSLPQASPTPSSARKKLPLRSFDSAVFEVTERPACAPPHLVKSSPVSLPPALDSTVLYSTCLSGTLYPIFKPRVSVLPPPRLAHCRIFERISTIGCEQNGLRFVDALQARHNGDTTKDWGKVKCDLSPSNNGRSC